MARAKVKLDLAGLELIKAQLRSKVLDEIGLEVVKEMKVFISQGISPVKSVSRFEGYAAQRLKGSKPDSQLYPRSVQKKFPSKAIRPVNLSLSGDFLKTLQHRVANNKLEIGHINAGGKTGKLIETHNEGKHPDVPRRQYLPTGKGENFVVSIQRLIKDLIVKAIKRNL